MPKSDKRQRKKQGRRQRIEEEVHAWRARRKKRLLVNLAVLVVVAGGVGAVAFTQLRPGEPAAGPSPSPGKSPNPGAPPMTIDPSKTYTGTIETSFGPIEVELAPSVSPNTVNSFVHLARQGFYDGLTFHRIVPGFAVQGGDPKGDGSGGPDYSVVDPPPPDTKYVKGTVAMAKTAAEPAGTAGSQFFIVPGDGAASLPPEYAVLGKVTSGFEVLEKIEQAPRNGEKPVEAIRIVRITIKES